MPAGGLDLTAPKGLDLGLRRYGDEFTEDLARGATSVALRIPDDLSPRPWLALLEVTGAARACLPGSN